ncbi:MAG: 2-isopropylmalate synthase [Alphaproteobacteria bacterium]
MANNRIIIFDTTLRDGEQSPGATMTQEEKCLIAESLDKLGVDVIEAGFAIASKGDFECVQAVAKKVKNAAVCSLARAKEADIEAAAKAIESANRGRIHTFISTSPIHMKHKLKMDASSVLDAVKQSVAYARNYIDDVEWSAEDATRTDIDFLCRCVEAAINSGATTINIPDTVGYTTPFEHQALFKQLIERVPNSDKAIFSAHCHNDLGMATANSLAAISAGVRQVECTINGLGERAGNAALEEIVMTIKTRHDVCPYETGIDTSYITRVSRLVSTLSGFSVQRNKAIVGANAFAHESGIHQDGMLKSKETYEIMTPESIGLKKSELVLGKHSGRAALRDKLKSLDIELSEEQFEIVFQGVKNLGDNKKHIMDEDIIAIIDESFLHEDNNISFVSYEVSGCSNQDKTATVTIRQNGKDKKVTSNSVGFMDSVFGAINTLTKKNPILEQYDVHAVTSGIDSQAEVSIMLSYDNLTFTGSGRDLDTITASAKAYISAVNKIMKYEQKQKRK